VTGATPRLDCIYVAASAHDARYTRICVASIRYFYPHVPVKLLAGGRLEHGLSEELALHCNVATADLRAADWGWGFVKLEPLFGPPGEKFLVVDSDTVFTGPMLSVWAGSSADFLVDDEQQTEADTHRLYYDWRNLAKIDPSALPPQFVFNSGQWFGTAGVLKREDLAAWIEWTMPRRLKHPEFFMPGDQGILNYVFNQKSSLGAVSIERRQIMRWPRHGMDGITAATIVNREAPPVIVHWAGIKSARLNALPGADVLRLFERRYYARIQFGFLLIRFRACRYFFAAAFRDLATRARLAIRRLSARPNRPALAPQTPSAQTLRPHDR